MDARPPRIVAAALLVLVSWSLPACAAGGDVPPGVRSSGPITEADIERLPSGTAYDAVQRLRPVWLRSRGPTSLRDPRPPLPVVYLDGTRRGEVSELHRIPGFDIHEIRYLSPRDATTRFGTGHAGGVILVSTRRE